MEPVGRLKASLVNSVDAASWCCCERWSREVKNALEGSCCGREAAGSWSVIRRFWQNLLLASVEAGLEPGTEVSLCSRGRGVVPRWLFSSLINSDDGNTSGCIATKSLTADTES